MWFWVLLCSLPQTLVAGVVGGFEGVRNLPGYISLKRGDDVYRDLFKRPRRKGDGIEQRSASRILREDYLRDDGTIDVDAIDAKILAIKRHEHVAFMTYCVEKLPRKVTHVQWCRGRASDKIKQKWRKNKRSTICAFAIGELQRARALAAGVHRDNINNAESQPFLEHLFQGLETFASILDVDPVNSDLFNSIVYGVNFNKARIGFEVEPANLVIPAALKDKHRQLQQQVFFSPQQLQDLAREGLDISSLDPLNSGFWRKPKSIRNFDTRNYNGQSGFPAELTDIDKEIAVTYDQGGRSTGRSPKMRVHYGDNEYKMKYLPAGFPIEHADSLSKILMRWVDASASEVNTETVVNNLAAALGFTVDPTFFKRSVRLYLPLADPTSAQEFDRAYQHLLADQRHWSLHEPEVALSDINQDVHGRWYIRMRSVSLERRSDADSDLKVGAHIKSAFSRTLKREFRAFALFSAWVADADVKDDNASLVLVGNARGRKVAYSAADMGYTLGSWFDRDAPNFLARDLVDRVRRKPDGSTYEVVLNYRVLLNTPYVLKAISISDAKWMTRLIAQLSPTQIKNAFLSAGYSELIGEYYTQIMLRRRDQLVETFGLMGETIVDGAGTKIVLKHESKMTDPDSYAVEGYEQYFKDGYLHDPEGHVSSNPGDFVRRYYDRNLVHATPGTLQDALWKTIVAYLQINAISAASKRLQKIKITNRTFGLQLLDGDFCESECFYDGLRVGITNFLPQRYLLRNPYDDNDKPLMLVDVYRFGFLLGADVGKDLPHRFGIDREINDTMPQLRYQKVYEFIKVKTLDSIVDSVKNLGELSPLQVLKYRKIHLQLIEQLQPGEALIASTYLSRGAGLEIGEYPFIGRPMVSAGVDLQHVVVSRKALLRSADKFLMQFSDLKATKFWAGLRGELLLDDFPLIGWEMEKLSKMDLLFEFSATDEHHSLMEKGLAASVPDDDMDDFAVVERTIESTKRKFIRLLKPMRYFFDEIDAATIKIGGTEGTNELHRATINEERENAYSTNLDSFITKDAQVFIKLRMNYNSTFGNRQHFQWVYRNMLPLLGKPFILFKPEDVVYYLYEFEFFGEVYVLPAGLARIMSYRDVSPSRFCIAYANAADELHPLQWCEQFYATRLGSLTRREQRYKNFLNRYVKAARLWLQPTEGMAEQDRHKLMRAKAHAIAKMFSANGFDAAVWKMLQRIAGEENIYRYGMLTSRTGAFPAQRKEIKMPKALRGEAGAQVREIYRDIVQSVQISTDPLFSELQDVFYEPMGEDMFDGE